MINPFPAQIASRESQIGSARAEISNLQNDLDILSRNRRRLEEAQSRCASNARIYHSDNDLLVRNTNSIQNIQRMRVARHCSRELRTHTTGSRKANADRATAAISRKINNELERVRAEIRQRELRISALQGQISSLNNQIANLRSQSAAWQPLGT